MITPIVEELANENAGSVKVAKINIDNSPNTAASYGVSSIPTLMIFKNGEVVEPFRRRAAKETPSGSHRAGQNVVSRPVVNALRGVLRCLAP